MKQSLCTKVQLFISGRKLKNRDTFSKSDPFCKVLMWNPQHSNFDEISRTEVLKNDLNPNWSTSITLDYYFETQQPLKFEVYDYDSHTASDSMGSVESTLGQIIGKGTIVLDLTTSGELTIRAEEVKESKDIIFLSLRAHNVAKMDTFGKSDPYLVFSRLSEDGQWLRVYRTEEVKNTLNPIWKPLEATVQALCNSDFARPISIECWDWDKSSSDDLIGACQTSLAELLTPQFRIELINPKKKTKKKYTNSGVLEVQHSHIQKVHSFIDFLRGGTCFRLMVAIDFTGSNGDPASPRSLHYLRDNSRNEYERAICAVGEILENYDMTRAYPVFGFGGKLGGGPVNHSFPLTGDQTNPFVLGVGGILQAYHSALRNTALSGPTLFQHILRVSMALAQQSPPGLQYNVLLILTDGEIHDMPATKSLIVEASRLPLSIIIVGLGNEDFNNMKALDSDKTLLSDGQGRTAVRDIVQFVPFRRVEGNPYVLAQEVLGEVPGQLVQFMKDIGHHPFSTQATTLQQPNEEVKH